jgi:anti-sigma factor RsiW
MVRGFERLMKDQATRDELLSAYLDDQLDAKDRARLDAQLKTDPALRSELEMLRRTVTLVCDLPPRPIPRNFILPHTVARKARPAPVTRRPKWLAPFLTAATTVVSLLFVAVLAGDLLFSGAGIMMQSAAPAPAADEGVVESAPVEKAVEEEQEAPQMLAVTEPPEKEVEAEAPAEIGEGEGLATPPPAAATLPEAPVEGEKVDIEPTPASEGTPVAATGGGGEPAVESPAPTSTPAAAEEADAAARSVTPEAEEIAPVPPPEPTATEPTERVLRDTEPAPNEVGEAEPSPGGREWGEYDEGDEGILFYVSPWRVAEVALGAFALLLVLITIWAWRARRR